MSVDFERDAFRGRSAAQHSVRLRRRNLLAAFVAARRPGDLVDVDCDAVCRSGVLFSASAQRGHDGT